MYTSINDEHGWSFELLCLTIARRRRGTAAVHAGSTKMPLFCARIVVTSSNPVVARSSGSKISQPSKTTGVLSGGENTIALGGERTLLS